jgi:hypothetical protein
VNGRIVYAWRRPVMHFFVIFCLYHQALFFENKYKNREDKPQWISWFQSAREWRLWYWEKMCDLKRK